MKAKEPFLEDEEGHPISRTAFRRMRKADKREQMLRWFGRNFEDPAQHTSYMSSEGGYLWNHGGPYDAKDELFGMFGDFVPEALIDEVVTEVQDENGIYDWAGTTHHQREYEDYDDDDPPPQPSPFDTFTERPTEKYGSQEDLDARERARVALQALLDALNAKKPVGIGHNNPPEDLIETQIVEELCSQATTLQVELLEEEPAISLVKKLGKALYSVSVAATKWVGRKIDLAVDTTIKTAVPITVTAVAASFSDPLHRAIAAIVGWLAIVTQKLF